MRKLKLEEVLMIEDVTENGNLPGALAHAYHPSYMKGGSQSEASPSKNMRPYLKNN
jgi:hypothetical protein